MYLLFDEKTEQKLIQQFNQTKNYICFTFTNNITLNDFENITVLKMFSDDNVFLTNYILNEYNLICNDNELYLTNKNIAVNLEELKNDKIINSKELLSEWFATHPYLFTDGKYYACTEEKQSLLNGNLASYERATKAGIDYQLKWNSTGEECVDWEYNNLLTLSLLIAAYVAPKVSKQQELELQIKACATIDELNEIEINYD